jgi:methionyl-tRNA formyltransferase
VRIVIMGTGPFAVPTAQRLVSAGYRIPMVVTRPVVDPTAKKLPSRPVFDWAIGHGFEIFEPASINDVGAIATVAAASPDLLFVCDYGQILSNECLASARLGGINLHGSLLPRHRGAAPVQWALLRGDDVAGVTVIHMTPRLDAGPALAIASTVIAPDETAEGLEPRLAELGVAASMHAIDILSTWDGTSAIGVVQDKSLVTKAPRFSKSDGALDFRLPADYLARLVRACQPWPGTFAELSWATGKTLRLIVRAARSIPAEKLSSTALQHAAPGTVAVVEAADIIGASTKKYGDFSIAPWQRMLGVTTGDGVFLAGRVQPAGKREMDVHELLRGHSVTADTQFILPETPGKMLE